MEAQGATSLQEALRYVPDITFQAAAGGTIGNNINLRGFSARTDIFLDGFRDRGQYYRDSFFAEICRSTAKSVVHAVVCKRLEPPQHWFWKIFPNLKLGATDAHVRIAPGINFPAAQQIANFQQMKLEPPYKPGDEVTDIMIDLVASDYLPLLMKSSHK